MLQLCGDNEYTQLGISSNDKNIKGHPIVSPPTNSHLDISSLFSYSVYSDHSVWITHHGKAHAIGLNHGCRICSSSKDKFKKETRIKIKDSNGNSVKILSAVCGEHYTLYQITSEDFTESSQLAYMYKDENHHQPLFLNLPGRHIIAIFGGAYTSAAIDSEGAIIIVTRFLFRLQEPHVEPTYLPDHERAVCIAFCGNMIIALTTGCRVFESSFSEDGKFTPFSEIHELRGKEIIGVNGTFAHCIAVSANGKVYGTGSNEHGRLGMGDRVKHFDKFTEISTLKDYRILVAYAGVTHSLFQTHEGQILACGTNGFGELLLQSEPSPNKVYVPVLTPITNASFCIAGAAKSAVFINCEPPPHCPNKRLLRAKDQEILEMSHRIDHLQRKLAKEHSDNKKNLTKIKKLEKDLEEARKDKLVILKPSQIAQYSKVKRIGHSQTAEVYQVNREEIFALKIIDTKSFRKEEADKQTEEEIDHEKLTKFYHEHQILNRLNHPNVVKIFAFSYGDDENGPSVLLEFCPSNLKHAVLHLSDEERVRVIVEISEAMNCVHGHGIVHGDLNLKNILLDQNKHVKVTDFGLRDLVHLELPKKDQIPVSRKYLFMAPELLQGQIEFDQKIDVFSFGVIVYFVLMKGKYPRLNLTNAEKGKRPPIPKSLSKFANNLIKSCWATDPRERPTFTEICETLKGNENKLLA